MRTLNADEEIARRKLADAIVAASGLMPDANAHKLWLVTLDEKTLTERLVLVQSQRGMTRYYKAGNLNYEKTLSLPPIRDGSQSVCFPVVPTPQERITVASIHPRLDQVPSV